MNGLQKENSMVKNAVPALMLTAEKYYDLREDYPKKACLVEIKLSLVTHR